jgi:hypothetical protein
MRRALSRALSPALVGFGIDLAIATAIFFLYL